MGVGHTINLHHNRILNNISAGVINDLGENLIAENNWWGCNEGPVRADCDGLTGLVNADPWLVLSAVAANASILPSTTTTVQSDLIHNSAAQEYIRQWILPMAFPAVFSAPDGGSLTLTGSETLNGALEDVDLLSHRSLT